MLLIYNIGIRFYYLIAYLFSFWDKKANHWILGQKNTKNKIKKWSRGSKKVLWVHAASLGEFEMGKPVFNKLLQELPKNKWQLVVTFFSPSGYNQKKNYKNASLVTYLPLDTNNNASFFLNKVKPNITLFIKYENWYYFFKKLNKKNIPLYIAGARFYKKQVFFNPYFGKWFVKILKLSKTIFVQREEDFNLTTKIGLNNIYISGDPRFDNVYENSLKIKKNERIKQFLKDKKIIVAGSTWEKEDQILLDSIEQLKNKYKFIIAPHELKESKFKKYEILKNVSTCRFSQLYLCKKLKNLDIIIVDKIGYLSELYQYGNVAFVGGGFGKGLHNILEPIIFGLPVIFGPNIIGFSEAKETLNLGISNVIKDKNQFLNVLKNIDEQKIKIIIKNYIYKNRGSSNKIVKKILQDIRPLQGNK